jgi:hypothetical protein
LMCAMVKCRVRWWFIHKHANDYPLSKIHFVHTQQIADLAVILSGRRRWYNQPYQGVSKCH